VDDAVVSPELILVSPPEVAAAARRALPDPATFLEAAPTIVRRSPATHGRFSRGSVAFTTLLALNCLLPFLLLIAARR
jgi:hypothetical protein